MFNSNLGGLFRVCFEVGGGGKIIPPSLKLVRIMLETSNLGRKYKLICSFRKYTFQCQGPLNFVDVSLFLQNINFFCSKKDLYSKQQCESCVGDFLVLLSVFVKQKGTITKNTTLQTLRPESGLQTAPNWSKIQKMTMTSLFSDMTSTSNFF